MPPPNHSATRTSAPFGLCGPVLWVVLCTAGACRIIDRTADSSERRPARSGEDTVTVANPAVLQQIEKQHVIGPAAARNLNYRVDWQYVGPDRNITQLSRQGDSVFALDDRNFLTRVKVDDGNRLWRVEAADPIEEVLGVTYINNRVYLTTGGAILVLDGATGAQVGKQPVEKIANTAPVVHGQFLIYGSRDGQVIWHSPQIGYQWRGYRVAQSITIPPALADGYLAAVGNDGTVMVLDASSATRYWSKRLLNPVVAPPAAGRGAVYVAGLDQNLWAFDITSGHTLWNVLTESPLHDPPVLIGERVYQQIPSQGLVCFNAMPLDSPGGERMWKSEDVRGSVICQRRDEVFVWDPASRRLSVLTVGRGSQVKSIDLPQAKSLIAAGENNNELYAASEDGRIVRLVPRN